MASNLSKYNDDLKKSKGTGTIVLDSIPDKNEKLREKWTNINNIAKVAGGLSSGGFVISLLSPFDIEGPLVEIITAVFAAGAFAVEKYSSNKIDQYSK